MHHEYLILFSLSVQFSSVAQSCLTLCDPMNRITPGLPVHHQLPEFTQTHVHRVSDAIQLSHPCPQFLPASGSFPMSQLCTWGGQSIGVSALASVLPISHYRSWQLFGDGLLWAWHCENDMSLNKTYTILTSSEKVVLKTWLHIRTTWEAF